MRRGGRHSGGFATRGRATGVVTCLLSAGLAFLACAHEERAAPEAPRAEVPVAPDLPAEPLEYVVADPHPNRSVPMFVMPLGKIGDGVILDGLRLIVPATARGEEPNRDAPAGRMRGAKEVTDPPLVGASRLPPWLGTAFLFWSDKSLYTSASFDGPLTPLVEVPDNVASVSFGPKSLLVRGANGERWSLDPKTGAPATVSPVGLVDVATLPDGRAAAITEFGFSLVSADRGEHWVDVTSQLSLPSTSVLVAEGALWLVPSSGSVVRVEAGGTLTTFDKAPVVKPNELRPKDPRWKADESPIRRAIRLGFPIDDTTALVASEGNMVKVNLASGALVSVASGRLPPDAVCEALRSQDDVILACSRPNGQSFVASHILGDKAPVIEQTFAASGLFYASDDGALAYGGPCTRAKASRLIVCVRSASGGWQEYDLENVADGGTPIDVGRWVPRADGSALGILAAPKMGSIDARSGEVHMWQAEGLPPSARNFPDLRNRYKGGREDNRVIDRLWTTTALGTLRAWIEGGAAEVAASGEVTVSPFAFERHAPAGPFAMTRNKDGRMWQTVDRGVSWSEVMGPLAAKSDKFSEPRLCSAVGCDLGGWYRIGWMATAPGSAELPVVAPSAPRLATPAIPLLACKPAGDVKTVTATRSEASPDDLGLGTAKITSTAGNPNTMLERALHGRGVLNPPHSVEVTPTRDEASPRALVHGYATTSNDDGGIVVQGPNKDPMALRRPVMFTAPFDPAGVVRKASFGVAEIVSAARGIGLSARELLGEDPTTIAGMTPLLTMDPAAPADLGFFGGNGLVGVLRSAPAARTRVVFRARKSEGALPVSAVSLANDEMAMLELESDGTEHVIKWGASGVVDLFDVAAPGAPEIYPANADALAVGPRGELALLRTPSGGTPASASDPALLMLSGAAPVPLAPWSTLVTADDPACKSDAGWRAIVSTVRPWVRIRGAGLHVEEDTASLARVRWSASRVCLEAIEVRVGDMKILGREFTGDRMVSAERDAESWVVARFTGTPAASRLGIVPGAEVRQSLECTLAH